jgi:hypothetical protein
MVEQQKYIMLHNRKRYVLLTRLRFKSLINKSLSGFFVLYKHSISRGIRKTTHFNLKDFFVKVYNFLQY